MSADPGHRAERGRVIGKQVPLPAGTMPFLPHPKAQFTAEPHTLSEEGGSISLIKWDTSGPLAGPPTVASHFLLPLPTNVCLCKTDVKGIIDLHVPRPIFRDLENTIKSVVPAHL